MTAGSGDALLLPSFDPGLEILFVRDPMNFRYGAGVFGPSPEYRSLDAIRPSLRDPNCTGPDPVYAIAMDVGRSDDLEELKRRMLLFGIVMYAAGRLGDEPVRSQGHVHGIAPQCGWSTPELFNADPTSVLVFGAWCHRQYGFDYTQMRAHHGLAWFPVLASDGELAWEANPHYSPSQLRRKKPRLYPELGVSGGPPIYHYVQRNPDAIQWISDPQRVCHLWDGFEP